MTGMVDGNSIPAILAASDIAVVAPIPNPDKSPFFGSPTKLFEYMAMGCAIVGSDLGQIARVLRPAPKLGALAPGDMELPHGACGIVVTPGCADELAGALQVLVDRPDWRTTLGANARARALARYTWSQHTDQIRRHDNVLRRCFSRDRAAHVERVRKEVSGHVVRQQLDDGADHDSR